MNIAHRRIAPRRARGTWSDYEREKRIWAAENPRATPDEYDRAVRAIARRLGI